MHRMFLQSALNVMQVAVALLARKGSVRKADIAEACKSLKLDLSDTQLSKQLKELCVSHGASWSLKELR